MNKQITARRFAAAFVAMLTCFAVVSPASAQLHPGPYGAGRYGYRSAGPYHHRAFGRHDGAVAGAAIAGLAIGAAVASQPHAVYVASPPGVVYVRPAPPPVLYVPPPPVVYAAPPVMLYTR